MSRCLAIAAIGLVSGCIIADPINQRPSIGIVREVDGEVFRGDEVKLHGHADDPENQLVFFQWRAYACTDAKAEELTGARPGCDRVPFYTEILDDAKFTVPLQRVDVPVPVQQVLVLLEAQDDFGATAKPIQELVIPISNAPPTVAMRKDTAIVCPPRTPGALFAPCYVVGTPSNIYAKIGDVDDWPAVPALEWTVYSPMNQPTYELVDPATPVAQDPADATHLLVGKTFTAHGIGDYEIDVTALDQLERACVEQGGSDCSKGFDKLTIHVVDDGPPCLVQWAPLAAAAPNAWPLTQPTLFQATVVFDELDPFPSIPGGSIGTTTFHWSILQPGASTRQALPTTGNSVGLDPASYQPGDIVELRIEIEDRNKTPVNCADASATCSVISDNSCIQRQTWRVEVR